MEERANIDNLYEYLSQIGQGSYASVHKAINKQTGEVCAIKKISSKDSELQNLISEIGILSNCKSENIVRYLNSYRSPNKDWMIVMEYCCGGSVKDAMRQLGRTMNVEQITVILRDVLNGLDYLHANKKIHRDVKAANILLNEEGIAKLGDFGVSEPLEASKKRSIIGTLLWLPPEVINQEQNYSTAIDIWSLGITIVEMGEGQPPFNELGQTAALEEIKNLGKPSPTFRDPSKWPANLVEFVGLCLDKDASRRKSAHELLSYDIMLKAPSNDVIKRLVAEVCTSLVNQTESSLFNKYKWLLKENIRLFSIYEERRMKVVKVDQMTSSHKNVMEQFEELIKGCKLRNDRIKDMRSNLDMITGEIQKLEREKTEQRSILEQSRGRKTSLVNNLKMFEQKRSDEALRRSKLEALESKR